MKTIRFFLFYLFLTLCDVAYSQDKIDSIDRNNSFSNTKTAKELRREKDSIAKNLPAIPDKSIVFIVRTGTLGMAIPLKLDCDSFEVGWIHSKTYLFTVINPGEHIFKASSENEFTLKVELEPGKIYYLDQEAKMGFAYARTKLKMLDPEIGKKDLMKCTISKHNRYPQYPKSKEIERTSKAGEL
jgi:hypothetical protein